MKPLKIKKSRIIESLLFYWSENESVKISKKIAFLLRFFKPAINP